MEILHPLIWGSITPYCSTFACRNSLLPPNNAFSLGRSSRITPSRGYCLSWKTPRKTNFLCSRLIITASNANAGSSNFSEESMAPSMIDGTVKDKDAASPRQLSGNKASVQAAGVMAVLIAAVTVAAIVKILASGGPTALITAIAKSGFFAAFTLIFVSEIGDKTFFIAALLAMRHSRGLVLLGASGALALMSVISVVIGRIFQSVPSRLQTTLPIGEYAAVILLIVFGVRSIKCAWELPSSEPKEKLTAEGGELAEAQEFIKKAEKNPSTPVTVLGEAFSLVFLAEWGDRSMLATIALGAAQSPAGVASGAIVGHVLATSLAVLGGAFLAKYISEKVVGYIGGVLFLVFAIATLIGAF